MSTDDNREIVRRFVDEVFVQGRSEAVDDLVADDFVAHSWGPMPPGREGLKRAVERVARGLADVSMRIEEEIAEGDRVVVRLTSHARQVGEFMGMPASNREYTIEEIHIFTVRDGRIAEHRHQADFLGMMRQLGALPAPG